nr:DUF3265 domain-containing protein [Vibrio jasicida]
MIRHAWHFYYALVLVIKVVCGSIVCVPHTLIGRYVNGEKSQNLNSNFLLKLIFTAALIR